MPLFPYDEEDFLTPKFNPNLPDLPVRRRPALIAPRPPDMPREMPGAPPDTPPRPGVIPAPKVGVVGPRSPDREAPIPEFRPKMTRSDEYYGAKDEYMAKTPGRGKSALTGALEAFAGGGGLPGALTGAVYGAIDPKGLREQRFNRQVRPRIYEGFALEDADRAAVQQAVADELNAAKTQAEIQELGQRHIPQSQRPRALIRSARGLYDPETGQIIPGTEPLPDTRQGNMTADQANAALTSEQGTVEEESQRSLEGRREMLKKHLTPDEKRIIEGGATSSDNPQAISRAWSRWQKIQDDELNSIRRVTGEKRKAAASEKRYGKKGQGGAITRSRSEFNSSKFPGARFDPD